ncbi:MAG: anion transporter [Deltaproteobacteria bacterium RIFOXYD12_FULL_56_24]|nr:MAG: anion transporter [Deltaproteobacteria bacterium RIFOXYD12_FULL_56_24]
MPDPAVLIFIITYLGVALGRIPGLMLDRTGIALLGAIAMIASGAVPLESAMGAIDLPTIILLYALMVLSAQLRLGGFYTWVIQRTTGMLDRPRLFLLTSMLAAALLSALLANDIVCLAFTPVLCLVLLKKGLNPLPFLLGLAAASNIGSAATIIGNPQNMLIGQVGRLHFGSFLFWCAPPTVIALAGAYFILCRTYQGRFAMPTVPQSLEQTAAWPEFNRWQSSKGLLAMLVLVALFFTPIPRELSAITVAGILLCSRKMHSRRIMELVDWHLLTLFCALFIVVHGITARNIPGLLMEAMSQHGLTITNLFALTGISALMSNLVSNVPAAMLLVQFLDPRVPEQWYVLALSSTFAGNLIIIGSIANLIVIEQARKFKIEISFKEHARAGIPITLFSLLVLVLLLYLGAGPR